MVTLNISSTSELNRNLEYLWPANNDDFLDWQGDWCYFLMSLDYVKQAVYSFDVGTTLTFETEQDKMFFLLKYT